LEHGECCAASLQSIGGESVLANLTPSNASVRDHVRKVLAKLKSYLKEMSTRAVRPTPRWRAVGSAIVLAGGMIAAAPGSCFDAHAQTAVSGRGPGEPAQHEADDVNYDHLLGGLLSNGNRQFLADLKAHIRRGDPREATDFLWRALEAGTIAALLLDRVQSPGLLAFLQSLDTPQPGARAVAGGASAKSADASPLQAELTVCRLAALMAIEARKKRPGYR
jgi:hypothetical protein